MLDKLEKAKRYDALKVAFEFAKEKYQRQKEDSGNRINLTETGAYDVISAYNKGMVDAYKQILEDLTNWSAEI